MSENNLTHFDDAGNAVMVDVSEKKVTFREAVAHDIITMNAEAFAAVQSGTVKKGDVLGVARIAGIMATKRTSELIFTTGGMSVDPDDRTPLAIKNTGAAIITYGAPVLPGAMFLVSYLDGVPVCGLPGCVMYAKRTIFDLLLPRLLADDPITAEDIARLGEGGLCLNCEVCHWPNCGFGHC